MRKLFILSLLAMMIAWGISGCGGGVEGTSADPLGTDVMMFGHKNDSTGTDWSTAMSVTLRGTVILTAKLKNSSDKPVVGREVSFGFVSNASGATLSSTNVNTDSTGEASIIYTAGMTAGFDVVRASISNGSTLITNITVGGGTGSYQMTLAADNTSPAAGQTAIITATVTDGSDNPAVGITVTFTLPVNESGARFVSASGTGVSSVPVTTDAAGNAVAVYFAGSNDPLVEVYDTVRATLANGSSNSVVITRSAGTAPPTPATYSIAVTANPTTLTTKTSNSVVTATVTATGTGTVSGKTVTFTVARGSLSVSSATTDGSGNARTTFTGDGGATGTGVVTASITIDDDTYSASVVINIP